MQSVAVPQRVAIVGGGITGLAAAYRLSELACGQEVRLFEASHRLGGVLETIRRDGFLIEGGADNWITNIPWAARLCQRIGFSDQLIETNPVHRHAFVICRGKLRKIPPGFVVMAPSRIWPVLATPILSPWGKLRLACEPWIKPAAAQDADESLASFVKRRLGREVYERLVQPLMGGIYTGDPEKLSLQSTMARFQEMEQTDGSLIRAMRRQAREQAAADRQRGDSGARYSMFVAPRDGMDSFVNHLAERLPAETIQRQTPVLAVRRAGDRWEVELGGSRPRRESFDAVILTSPAHVTARLLRPLEAGTADELAGIPHASCAIVSLGYRRQQIRHPLDGFGFVVPFVERLDILSASFSSVKYAGRAPADKVLIRVFMGGACQPELAELSDSKQTALATANLSKLLGITGPPLLVEIARRPHAMPQYYVGHAARTARIESGFRNLPGLFLAGNALHGVGIPQCIRSAELAAEKALAWTASKVAS